MDRKTAAPRLYNLFLRLQRRNRAIGPLHGTKLKLVESHLLSELDAHPGADIKALTHLLALNQSTVSRIAARLVKAGYLRTAPDSGDGRRVRIEITAAGGRAMRAVDRGADKLLAGFSRSFSRDEIERLRLHFQAFADGFGHPRCSPRRGEHRFRAEQRRIARCLRVIDLRQKGSHLSLAEHQALRLLVERGLPVSPSTLADSLATQRSALSVTLRKLRERAFIHTARNSSDGRGELVEISAAGRKALRFQEEKRVLEVERALAEFSERELGDFVALLERLVDDSRDTSKEFGKRFKVRALTSEQSRSAARTFYLERISRSGDFTGVPEALFGAEQRCFGMYDGEALVAVAQVCPGGNRLFASILRPDEHRFDEHFLAITLDPAQSDSIGAKNPPRIRELEGRDP